MRYVYLAGPIGGLSYKEAKDGWRQEYASKVGKNPAIMLLSPMRGTEFLSMAKMGGGFDHHYGPGAFSSPHGTLKRDLDDIRRADLLVVGGLNEVRKQASLGTMMEIGMAVALDKAILLIGPLRPPHDHKWLQVAADYYAESVDEAARATHLILMEGV